MKLNVPHLNENLDSLGHFNFKLKFWQIKNGTYYAWGWLIRGCRAMLAFKKFEGKKIKKKI